MSGVAAALRDRAGALLFALGITRPGRGRAGHLHVATFHRVLPEELRRGYPLPGLAVTPEELGWFLDFFARHYTCGTLRETMECWRRGSSAPTLALTFDDAQRDNYEFARPLLDARGLHATFFAPVESVLRDEPIWHDRLAFAVHRALELEEPEVRAALDALAPDGREPAPRACVAAAKRLAPAERMHRLERLEAALGGPVRPEWDGMMTCEQLRTLAAAGHEIGSHSMSHALLPQCDASGLEREVAGSRRELEARLGVEVDSFCYPDGACDARTLEAVRRAGYARAVTTRWGSNPPGSSGLELQRCDMNSQHARDASGRLSQARLAWRLSGLHPGLGSA